MVTAWAGQVGAWPASPLAASAVAQGGSRRFSIGSVRVTWLMRATNSNTSPGDMAAKCVAFAGHVEGGAGSGVPPVVAAGLAAAERCTHASEEAGSG